MTNLFSGLKVVDLSTVLAGPSVGMFFAELGADVIKIENPNHPDVTRSWKLPSESKDSSVSAYFSSINYKKSYRSIDLKTVEGQEELFDLLSDTDVLISNFKRSDYARFNLDEANLKEQFPKLIHGRISGYGSDNYRTAFDLILQAESGFMSINGTPDSGPVKMPVALIDVLSAHHLKEGILCAMLNREKTGLGGTVHVSLYEAAVSSLVNQASNYLMGGVVPERIGSLHPNIAPYGEIFTTKDNRSITFAIGTNAHFSKLCSALNCEDLVEDPKFIDNQNRVVNRKELYNVLAKQVKDQVCDTLLDQMLQLNVPAGEIKSIDQVFTNNIAQALIREEVIDSVPTKRVSSTIFKYHGN
jgi:crotonobetainyl-CoA:carnitine CoA-transferase CaiB-like acyl-CoA transferase